MRFKCGTMDIALKCAEHKHTESDKSTFCSETLTTLDVNANFHPKQCAKAFKQIIYHL